MVYLRVYSGNGGNQLVDVGGCDMVDSINSLTHSVNNSVIIVQQCNSGDSVVSSLGNRFPPPLP